MRLSVNYWIERSGDPDELLADSARIAAFVNNAYAIDPHMVDLRSYPATLPGSEVTDKIQKISKPYPAPLYYREGGTVEQSDYDRYTRRLALEQIADEVEVRFGMVLQRANMRAWPTVDAVFKSAETIDLDRFQENGLFPADVVAVLHESLDGEWYFVQSYNYAAWVRQQSVVIGDRDTILDYASAEPFLVIAGNRASTNFNPHTPEISELQLDMGVRLKLVQAEDAEPSIDGQNTQASYIVSMPIRDAGGELDFRNVLIARSQDVHVGYMPYTRRNLLHQAFKFLGERYGWGHSYNARDCTGLVQEVFKTFGFLLPRNSSQQAQSEVGENQRFAADLPDEDKLATLARAEVGDLLYSPGHVMLYLGMVDGEPFVIHDLSGSGWTDDDGVFQQGTLNGVSVTSLRQVHTTPEQTYFEQLYAIKRLR
jgi:cell wall-associated NlpC family hydrolase